MEITGNENFKTGKNTVIISVKAENGDVREYKLIVNRKNITTTTLTEEEYAIGVKKGNESLVKSLNEFLELIKTNGQLESLLKQYFGE